MDRPRPHPTSTPAPAPALEQTAKAFESALDRLRPTLVSRSRQAPARPRSAWCGPDGTPLGSIEPAMAQALCAAGLPWAVDETAPGPGVGRQASGPPGADPALPRWRVGSPVAGPGQAHAALNEALARTARWLQAQGLGGRWRDEALAVTDALGVEHARVERAAVRVLGITTFAVHLCGYSRGPEGQPLQWLQQRALDKATDPGLWDTLMGGQCGAGETLADTLERETWEEAGLRLPMLEGLVDAGRCSFERPVSDGWLVEHIDLFEAWVPDGLQPVNQDGEVERFETATPADVAARIERGEVTLEAALMMARAVRARAAR